jgi:hypothetical protein
VAFEFSYSNPSSGHRPVGAYGFTFRGLAETQLVPVPRGADWPEITISTQFLAAEPMVRSVTGETALLPLVDGSWAALDRRRGRATLLARRPDDSQLAHPFLATVAVIFAWWLRRHAFHGGAFADAKGGAWALLGQRAAGKSSTLAALAAGGSTIVTDDLLALAGGSVLAGPRIIDLRPDTARRLNARTGSVVRDGARYRLPLGPTPAEPPLRGWIFLEWGQELSLRRLTPSEWLTGATSHLNTITRGAPSILDLAGADAWELTRPQTFESLETTVDQIRALVDR